jgi:RNA polymerase sigma-B factor
MTVLTAPPVNTTTPRAIAPATPAPGHTRPDTAAVAAVTAIETRGRRSQPAHTDRALTGQLLGQRDRLPVDHPDRAALRARAIEANLPMARHLANRYAGRGEPFDDLAQVASVALIRAIDRFDPSRQVAFASYAVPSILGALKRHFRDTAWAIRVSRRTQELTLDLAAATADLSQQLGRTPTSTDLAHHLHVHTDDIAIALGAGRSYRTTSLNTAPRGADNADAVELIDLVGDTDTGYARVEDFMLLRPLFVALSPRQQRILTMRFAADMTQAEIAVDLGISQMHVSRLLTQSLTRLRTGMRC